ncbi:hypothetical protein [Streptomyces fuscigenes]|uniref:hypothetical protein n=1 Tax=Streptomyces fuscigenes TaxID=1528880 RepID=UPI001F16EB27|nr:hypothetical protein [Streptomyces fuscigenes]MCF3960917.1 hypothetical protein [Streptomyces fuscigenes]
MSTTPSPSPRPAAVVNAEIRALWGRGQLTAAERAAYQRLLVEWAAAVRGEVAQAA